MKRFALLALVAAMVFSLVACGTPAPAPATEAAPAATEAPAAPAPTEAPAEPAETVLKVQVSVEVASMDPQIARDSVSFEVISAVNEGLFSVDKDGNAIPAMAEKAEISEDGLTRTFTLRDAKWADGTPVTAHDFVFAWRRAADPATASEYAFMMETAGIKNAKAVMSGELPVEELGVRAESDKVLVVELDRPVAFFDTLTSFATFMPVNQAFYEKCGAQFATTAETVNANGPFMLTSYDPAAMTVTAVKNPNYWDAANVKLEGIEFQVIKESQAAALAFDNGDVHITSISGEQVQKYAGTDSFTAVQQGTLQFVSPNINVAGLENLNLRMAMALAIDRQAVCDYILKDGSIPANYCVPVGLATGPDGKDFRDDPTGERTYLVSDKEKAVEYYEKAKQELGRDTFEYTMILDDTEEIIRIGEFIKAELEETLPGVSITIEQMPKKSRIARVQEGDYDLAMFRWGPDYADPMTYMDLFMTGGACNYADWKNEEYDALIESCKSGELSVKPAERWEAMKAAEKIAMDEVVVIPIMQKCQVLLTNGNVEGVEYHVISPDKIFKNVEIN